MALIEHSVKDKLILRRMDAESNGCRVQSRTDAATGRVAVSRCCMGLSADIRTTVQVSIGQHPRAISEIDHFSIDA